MFRTSFSVFTAEVSASCGVGRVAESLGILAEPACDL